MSDSGAVVKQLQCEYQVNPLGIDVVSPRLSWIVESKQRSWKQSSYQILVASSIEALEQDKADLWDSGKVESGQTIHIVYEGKALKSKTRYHWKVRVQDNNDKASAWSESGWWETALLEADDWKAEWISDGKKNPEKDEDFYKDDPAPVFRKEFDIEKTIEKARVYITGLGFYEAKINGQGVGENVLDPGWTSYAKRILYSTFDVTKLLKQGENALSVSLGNGWFNPLPMKMWGKNNLRTKLTIGRPQFIAQLELTYKDGTTQCLITDDNWKVADGPIVRNNVYLGEIYDARRELTNWRNAEIVKRELGKLCAQFQPAIKITKKLKPVKITEPAPGVFIFDMGQNFAGWARLKVKGPAGTKVKLRYGELLYPDGTLNVMTTVGGQIKPQASEVTPNGVDAGPGAPKLAEQSDTYILKGQGQETYSPRFCYRAFRYVEVTGFPGKPTLDSIEGLRLNSDVEPVGSFSCSNEMFNRLQDVIGWTFLSNLFSVQTDCPGREKFGYGGDPVVFAEAQSFGFDMAGMYTKTVIDFADAALPSGAITETAPSIGHDDESLGQGSGPIGWMLVLPYLQEILYQYYGDRRIIEDQYETARRSIEFIRSKAENHIISVGLSDHETIDPKAIALTSTAFYYHHAKLLTRFARILGKKNDAKQYTKLAEQIKAAFIERFLELGTGRFDIHTQACQSFALYYGLVPDDERQKAVDVLVDEIMNRHKGHLATGIFGTKFMLDVLMRADRNDIAYMIADKRDFPGWGYMLENGATTLWEHWAFSDNTFSHNHSMFGSVSEWFFKALAGIQAAPDAVGFDKIIIRPRITGDLTWVKAGYKSVRGEIAVDWRLGKKDFKLNVTIPANTIATIYIPTDTPEKVVESGKVADKAEGVKFLRTKNRAAVYELGSGSYSFTCQDFER